QLTERFYDDEASFNHSVESNVSYLLSKAVEERGNATFLVSGGSTPVSLYQSLSNNDLFWNQIQVAMVDERWVKTDDDSSNERLIRSTLLQNNAKDAKLVTMKTMAKQATDAEKEINQTYSNLNVPFDVTVLGMGSDGHMASLFPDSDGLEDAVTQSGTFCKSIKAENNYTIGDVTERMSLTLHGLLQSKVIFILLRGREKLMTYRKALRGSNVFEMPIRAILHQKDIPVIVNWAP
ncbi:MAG: 6-phosphogluconolactonase, partial [Gammaproteobacteria bacterium]|nr:6-phosphogluconolactonase [Gammaproteobacteria bacterium]